MLKQVTWLGAEERAETVKADEGIARCVMCRASVIASTSRVAVRGSDCCRAWRARMSPHPRRYRCYLQREEDWRQDVLGQQQAFLFTIEQAVATKVSRQAVEPDQYGWQESLGY